MTMAHMMAEKGIVELDDIFHVFANPIPRILNTT